MNKYLLFGGKFQSPKGGWGDFLASFKTYSSAVEYYEMLKRSGEFAWVDVVDISEMKSQRLLWPKEGYELHD